VLGLRDEVWWGRLARPDPHARAGGEPMRLHEPPADAEGHDPKAPARSGLLGGDTGGMMPRSVEGRPVSRVTEDFPAWARGRPAAEGRRASLLTWDDAARHVSARVRAWIEAHERRARAEGGVRIVARHLPVKAPRLNAIEPEWAHGGRAIIEPRRKLTASEVVERVCGFYGCEHLDRLSQQVA
jgi:hypothetical protein